MTHTAGFTETEEEILETVTEIAQELIDEHLGHCEIPWRLTWNNRRRQLGCCSYWPREISLSIPNTLASPMEEVIDTILHEIAHALAGYGAQHGPKWKAIARELGAIPKACKTISYSLDDYKYAMECVTCGEVWGRYRLKYSDYHHTPCRKQHGPEAGKITIRPWN